MLISTLIWGDISWYRSLLRAHILWNYTTESGKICIIPTFTSNFIDASRYHDPITVVLCVDGNEVVFVVHVLLNIMYFSLSQIFMFCMYTKILEVNLFAFAYRLFHEDFSSIIGDFCIGTHSFFPALYVF